VGWLAAFGMALAGPSPAAAAESAAGDAAAAAASPTDPAAEQGIASLDWLTGSWVEERGQQRTEESWSANQPGVLVGVNRVYRGETLAFFEYLRIERAADGEIVYQARPQGREPTPFRLVEQGEHRAVFENPQHDFPRRLLYWLDDQGVLQIRAVGEEAGVTKALAWSLVAGTLRSPDLE
jgi:hypothetical protein